MLPKLTNLTPGDLDDAIQSTNQRLDELIQTKHNIRVVIGATTHTFNTRLDNQDVIMDSRFTNLTNMINDRFATLTAQNNPTSSTTTVTPSPIPTQDSITTTNSNLTSLPVSLPNTLIHSRPSQPKINPTGYPPTPLFSITGNYYQTPPHGYSPVQPYQQQTQYTQQSHIFSPFVQNHSFQHQLFTTPQQPYQTPNSNSVVLMRLTRSNGSSKRSNFSFITTSQMGHII